jgi:hypothetical protein
LFKGIGEDLECLLEPFLELTNIVSGSTYVTCSIVIPGVQRLIDIKHVYTSKNNNEFLDDLAVRMADDLEYRSKRYLSNDLMVAAPFMDPRYKKFKYIQDQDLRDLLQFRAKKYIKCVYRKQ